MVKGIGRQNILIVYGHGDVASGNLLLRQFDCKHLVVGEREFFDNDHIAVAMQE